MVDQPAPSPTSGGMPVFDPTATGASPSPSAGTKKPKAQTQANAVSSNDIAGGSTALVYWGPGNIVHRNTRGGDSQDAANQALGIRNRPSDQTRTIQQAVSDWYTWSDQERRAFGLKAYRLGLVTDPNKFADVLGVWQDAVIQASNYYTVGGRKITPWQALDIIGGTATKGTGAGIGPKTQTGTTTSINIPTVDDAHALTKQIFQSLMGRDPSGDELSRYASMVTSYAQKHPTVTKTTTTTDSHGNSTSSSSQSGGGSGAGLQDVLTNQAKADPEYGAYQAATTYYNALLQAIGGTGG